ncbi:MAG: FAD-dependent oxidoreductase [Burkholderiaceae bacterium]
MTTRPAAIRFAPPYDLPRWPFVPPPESSRDDIVRHPVVIVGAGLSGLTLACDLAVRGVHCLLLDDDDTVGARGASSRGICYAQKSLEIFARLGIYERIRAKGIQWSVGRTYIGHDELYRFDLQTDSLSEQPPFINLQQFYVEWFLVERILEIGRTDLRWKNRVTSIEPTDDAVRLQIETPAGYYAIDAALLVDATGANSPIRTQLGLDPHTSLATDRWCITDVRFDDPLPAERRTWTEAPFNEGRAVWQHLMADNVWRMDYQMAPDADPEWIARPEVASARLRQQLGPDVAFEFVWIGPYQYRDLLLDDFRHGRVFFIGDAAHVVSPFGARGGNNGIQDAANLAWKLAHLSEGLADDALLDSYQAERHPAALENLTITRRTAAFLAPPSKGARLFRDALLALARAHPFARLMVDTGRMARANDYPDSCWLPAGGRSVPNIRFGQTTLMQALGRSNRYLALWFGAPDAPAAEAATSNGIEVISLEPDDVTGRVFDARAGSLALIRPDAYLVGVLHEAQADDVDALIGRLQRAARRA